MPEQISLADDLMEGAEEVGAELGVTPRRAFQLMEKKVIPAFKLGGTWFARKSTIRRHIETLERGETA